MSKLKLSKYLLLVLLSTFVSVFFIMVDKTYSGIKETEDKILSIPQAKPINPTLDTLFLDELEKLDYYDVNSLSIFSATQSAVSPIPTP